MRLTTLTVRFCQRRQFEFCCKQGALLLNLADRTEQEDALVRTCRLVQPLRCTVANHGEFLWLLLKGRQ